MNKPPADYQRDFLICRTFGHAWQIGSSASESASFWGFVLNCRTCHTRRIDSVNRRTGALENRKYEYPDDYRTHGDLQRTEFRVALIRSMNGDA